MMMITAVEAGPAFHPLAGIFPLMEGEAFAGLVEDIRAHGQQEPIILHQGKILDGRNRLLALRSLGREPAYEIFGLAIETPNLAIAAALAGRAVTDEELSRLPRALWHLPPDFTIAGVPDVDALAFVISRNLHRRHLTDAQRALIAADLATLGRGRPRQPATGENPPIGGIIAPAPAPAPAMTTASAAEALGVPERTVERARMVREQGVPELVDQVRSGAASIAAAATVAALPKDEQKAIIAAIAGSSSSSGAFRAVVKDLRAVDQQAKKERREIRERDLGARQRALPEKRFGVIYADPEWPWEVWGEETGKDRSPENHYPTSSVNDIVLRPVGDIAAKDCVLFLWATVPALPAALYVMKGWGFTYKSHFIWEKDRLGTGHINRNKHELLLYGTRGAPPAPAPGTQWPSVVEAPVGRHSEKPEIFAELIEAYFPSLPKIELNARRARPGWEVWGFEAPEGNEIPAGSPVSSAGQPEHVGVSASDLASPAEDEGLGGNHRPLSGAGPKPSAGASADGTLTLGDLDEWAALRAVEAGEAIGEAWARYLAGLHLVDRRGSALTFTALGRERFARLTRFANATHDQRRAMRAEDSGVGQSNRPFGREAWGVHDA